VPSIGRDQDVGEHRIEEGSGDFDAVIVEHGEIVFEIVADFFGWAIQQRTKLGFEPLVIRQIPRLVGRP
jgi:hypothetical protein